MVAATAEWLTNSTILWADRGFIRRFHLTSNTSRPKCFILFVSGVQHKPSSCTSFLLLPLDFSPSFVVTTVTGTDKGCTTNGRLTGLFKHPGQWPKFMTLRLAGGLDAPALNSVASITLTGSDKGLSVIFEFPILHLLRILESSLSSRFRICTVRLSELL